MKIGTILDSPKSVGLEIVLGVDESNYPEKCLILFVLDNGRIYHYPKVFFDRDIPEGITHIYD